MMEEKATMERDTPMENEMKKGGLEDPDQKVGDGQKEGGWVPFETVPEDDESMAPLDVVTEKKETMAVNSTLGNRSPLKESP